MNKVINQIKQQIKQLLFKFREATLLTSHIRNLRHLRVVGTLASAGLITVMTLTVHPIINKTQSAEAASGIASITSLTMDLTQSAANLNLVVRDDTGTFASSSAEELASFSISTNNYTGYTLSIAGSDDNGELNNENGASFSSVSIATDAYTFTNGSSSAYNGKWGYLPSKYNSEDNTDFLPSPTTTASTLNTTSCANGEPTATCPNNQAEDNYTIGLGARADYSVPAGTYTNTFILTAVGNPVGYAINYADNSGDSTVANLPSATSSAVSGTTNETTVNLTTSVPTRTRYAFEYWCLGEVTDNGTVCNGTRYDSGSEFGISQIAETSTTLYAVWKLNAYDITIKTNTGISKVTLNGTECTSTSGCVVTGLISGQSYTLTATAATHYTFSSWDAGSNGSVAANNASTTYTVGAGPSTITPIATQNKYTITFKTSNASSIVFNGTTYTNNQTTQIPAGTYKIYGNYATKYAFSSWGLSGSGSFANSAYQYTTFTVAGAATITLTGRSVTTAIQNLSSSSCTTTPTPVYDNRDNNVYWIAKLADNKCWMLDNLRLGSTSSISLTTSNTNIASNWTLPASSSSGFYKYDTAMINTASKDQTTTSYGSGSGKIGVYYNYCAASAGTYCMASNSGSGNASYDICPKGWRMPTGGSSGEYKALYTAYSSNATNFRNALSTPLSGYFDSNSASGQGSGGSFLSSTYSNGSNMHSLKVSSSMVYPTEYSGRLFGGSVRCILK